VTTQVKGSQIQDGTISSADIDDSLEKDFTKVRASTDDLTPGFLGSKLTAGSNVTITLTGDAGTNQSLTINSSGGSPGGSQGEVQYRDESGTFAGNPGLVFDDVAESLTITNLSVSECITAIGPVAMMGEVLMMSAFTAESSGLISGSAAVGGDLSVTGTATLIGESAFINDVTFLSNTNVEGDINVSGIINGSRFAVDKLSSNAELTLFQYFVVVDTNSGVIDLILPTVSESSGKTYVLKRSGSNNVNVLVNQVDGSGSGSTKIDNSSSITLTADLQSIRLFCDGDKWWTW